MNTCLVGGPLERFPAPLDILADPLDRVAAGGGKAGEK